MKKLLLACLCGLSGVGAIAAPCLPVDQLIALDNQYEDAMRRNDAPLLERLLADEYIWVHTLASATDTKADLVGRAKAKANVHKSRSTSEVKAQVVNDTVVLRGISTVEAWNEDKTTWRVNRYTYMRTWVTVGGQCKLLSNMTQNISSVPNKQ